MRRTLFGLATLAILMATTNTASAQHGRVNRTEIHNSGNGQGNYIGVRNGPRGFPGGFHPGFAGGFQPGYGGGFQPGFGGGGFGGHQGGGFDASGSAYYPGYHSPTGIPYFGGVNVNVITNSANGVGNTIGVGNNGGGGSGLNINVITNSGNGVGNTIKLRNR